jgi:hypothetical protein
MVKATARGTGIEFSAPLLCNLAGLSLGQGLIGDRIF